MTETFFIEKYKWLLRLCDVMFVLALLFNFGALALTNALVVKQDSVFLENNPIVAEANDYELHPEHMSNLLIFVVSIIPYFCIIGSYLLWRCTVRTKVSLVFGTLAVSWVFMLLTSDFFSNLGYFIGRAALC